MKETIFKKVGEVVTRNPKVLIVVGVCGMVGGTVLACKKTIEAKDVIEKSEETITEIKNAKAGSEEYHDADYKKDLGNAYLKSGLELGKIYAPVILLDALSIGAIFYGKRVICKENAALIAGYKILDKGYSEYKDKVVKEFGKNVDARLRNGIHEEEIEVEEVSKDGKKSKKKKKIDVIDPTHISPYAKFFDDSCQQYDKNNPEHNKKYILEVQDECNRILDKDGYIVLNEVYKELGLPDTEAGDYVGWIKNESSPTTKVDFGMFNPYIAANRDFVNGYEPVILLDFNVDGYILDQI